MHNRSNNIIFAEKTLSMLLGKKEACVHPSTHTGKFVGSEEHCPK